VNDDGCGAHEAEQPGRVQPAHQRDRQGNYDTQSDRLHGRHCRAAWILFAGAARHHRGRSHAKTHGHAEHDGQHAFGERHGGHSLRAQPRYEEDIHDPE